MKIWDDEGNEVVDITFYGDGNGDWVEQEIPEGKEIIGMFCSTVKHHDMTSLGFIVWTPSPMAL